MKKVLFFITALMGICSISAQSKEGTIIYERKVNGHRNIQDEQMKAMIPEFRISKQMLVFNDQISIYKDAPDENAPDPFAASGGAGMRTFSFGPKEGVLYANFTETKSVKSVSLQDKDYLIVDTIQKEAWKLTGETKTILGYACLKATRKATVEVRTPRTVIMRGSETTSSPANEAPKTKEIEIVAWYTESLVSPAGPEKYYQLPGVILQLDADNGGTVYTALEVKTKADEKLLKEPKKGKVITQAEMNKIQTDMINSIMQGGGIRINQ